MEIAGYLMALVIGISLGLIGGGGSILAVPTLAYLFHLDEKVSTAYSLFIVGVAALVGGLRQHQNRNVDWRTAIVFGIPAIVGVWLVRNYVVPAMPDTIWTIGDFELTRRMVMFGIFALLMFIAAYTMLLERVDRGSGQVAYNYPLILVEGLAVGGLTGFVGAGGGFFNYSRFGRFSKFRNEKSDWHFVNHYCD